MAADPWASLIDGPRAAPKPRAPAPRPPAAQPRRAVNPAGPGQLAPVKAGAPPPPPPPGSAPARAPARAPPAPPARTPWGSLAQTFSSPEDYRAHAPPVGQETPWDIPAAITHRFIPTAIDAAVNAARGAVTRDPRNTFAAVSANEPVSMGLIRALAGVPQPTPPAGPNRGRLGSSMAADAVRNLNRRYVGISPQHPAGTWQAPVSTAVQDPGGTAIDLGAAAAGGEGLAGDTAVGRALGAAKYVDPVQLTGRAAASTARAAQVAMRGGPVFDATGAFTPKARAQLLKSAPYLKPSDLDDPGVKSAYGPVLQRKGINDAAVKEGSIRYHTDADAPVPRGPVTGVNPPVKAQPVTGEMISDSKKQVGGNMQQIAGGAPDDSVLGTNLRDAHQAAADRVDSAYDNARNWSPGMIEPSSFQQALTKNVNDMLSSEKLPTDPDLLQTNHPQTKAAIDRLMSATQDFGDKWQLTFPNLSDLRQGIGSLDTGLGDHMTGSLKNAFDQSVMDMKDTPGGVQPGTPDESFTNYADARQANVDYHQAFGRDANPVVKRAVKAGGFKGPASDPTDVDLGGSEIAAHNTLANGLARPTLIGGGTKLYEDLNNNVFDPSQQQALDDHVRQTQLATDPKTGAFLKDPADIQSFLDSPLGMRTVSPEEATQVRMGLNAHDALDSTMRGGGQMPGFLPFPVRLGLGAATGAAGAYFLHPILKDFSPYITEPIGSLAGAGVEAVGERATARRAINAAKSGAPSATARSDPLTYGVQGAGNVGAPTISAAHLAGEQPGPPPAPPDELPPPAQSNIDFGEAPKPLPPPSPEESGKWDKLIGKDDTNAVGAPPADQNIQFAAGGRVAFAEGGNVVSLVDRLMTRAEREGKATREATKPLLGLDDATVHKALAIANRGI